MDLAGTARHCPCMGPDFLRRADWLNRERVRAYLIVLAFVNVAAIVILVATSKGGVDRNGFLLGTDFLSFWTAGRMLAAHLPVYDTAAHIAAQRVWFASPTGYTAFFYPPSFLPFCRPLGTLPYFPALATWLLATGALFVFAATRWLRAFPSGAPAWPLLLVAFAPAFITVTHGQTSFLVAGLLGLGTLLVRRAPLAAGVLYGLATIKPQFGLLIPLVLVLSGEWRVIVAAAAAALGLALLSSVAFGFDQWTGWMALGHNAGAVLSQGQVGYGKMVSTMSAALLLGLPGGLAIVLQALVSLFVAGALCTAAWRHGWSDALGAAMLAGALLATPFVLDYDLALLAFPLIWLACQQARDWERITIFIAFGLGIFARPLAVFAGLPIAPVVLLILFTLLVRRALDPHEPPGQSRKTTTMEHA